MKDNDFFLLNYTAGHIIAQAVDSYRYRPIFSHLFGLLHVFKGNKLLWEREAIRYTPRPFHPRSRTAADNCRGVTFTQKVGGRTDFLPLLPLPSIFLHSLCFPLLRPFPFLSSPLPLEVGPLIQLGRLGDRCELPQQVWGRAPTEIEFGAF